MRLFRRRKLPEDKRPALGPEERIVAWAKAAGDDVVVVTNRGVWLPGCTERLGWHEIHKATWSGRQLGLVAAREVGHDDAYAIVEDLPPTVHTLIEPDHVPEQVRTRLNRSIAYTSHHPMPGGGGARVVARRVSGVDGLRWMVRFDAGADALDPQARAIAGELVVQAQNGAGGSGR